MTTTDAVTAQRPGRAFYLTVFLGLAVGIVIVALVEVLDVSRGLRDVGLVIGGALIGLMSLWFDEVLRARPERHRSEQDRDALLARVSEMQEIIAKQERREALLTQTETDAAYYLGYAATALPMTEPLEEHLALIREFCLELGLEMSGDELEVVRASSLSADDAERLTAMLLKKGRSLKPALWCFFQLGNTVAWLHDQLKRWRQTQDILVKLESLHENPFLQMDPRYYAMVDELVRLLGPYRLAVADENRAMLSEEVLAAVSQSPPVLVQGRDTVRPVSSTEWIWVTADSEMVPMRIIGDYAILARSPDLYEVSDRSAPDEATRITRDGSGWHCSAHTNATEQSPCEDIKLVLYATDGGKPVTEARVVAVRTEPVEPDREGSESQQG
jgi:hypothetical protein